VDAWGFVSDAGVEAGLKERVDEAHGGDECGAEEEAYAAFAPGFVPEHNDS
jgi:hypothetical protein